MIIEIDSIPIEIILKPIKRINLRIYPPDGQVKVSAPLHLSERLIRHHLQDKISWIAAQRLRIQAKSHSKVEELYKSGSLVVFKGKRYSLLVEEHHGPSHVCIKDEFICCYTQPKTSSSQIQALLERWYRCEMESVIPQLINKWQAIIGVQVREWGIKKMKTRWGSCNTRVARIWLNLSLIQKHPLCLEYVLVHELVHLLEASHNSRFHALMTHYMPDWKDYKQLLEGKAKTQTEVDCA